MVIAVVLIAVLLVAMVLLLAGGSFFPKQENTAEKFGLKVTENEDGDWSIGITRGSEDMRNVKLKITDSTGRVVHSSSLESLDWDVGDYYDDERQRISGRRR